jgi:sulfofructose kinase
MDAFPVDVSDTLGAGDVLHGALAVALARGMPHHDAFRYASAAAALKCTQSGGARAAPTHVALRDFMKGLP